MAKEVRVSFASAYVRACEHDNLISYGWVLVNFFSWMMKNWSMFESDRILDMFYVNGLIYTSVSA